MGSNARRAAKRGAVVIWCAAAACSPPDFDPRALPHRADVAAWPREERLLRAVADLASPSLPAAAPAPLAETAAEPPPPREVAVAVGQGAAGVCGAVLERVFADALPGFAVAPATHPDRDAIELVLQGRADFALAAHELSARDQAAGLCATRLGVELWALAASQSAPLQSLTRAQVRKVLTGEARSWIDLGQYGGTLTVHVPADRGLAERASRALIPGDPFATSCVGLGDGALADVARNPGAIAVVRVGQALPDGVRLLQIDWSPPTSEAFAIGSYPHGAPLALVTAGPPTGAAQAFAAFVRSAPGRELLAGRLLAAK